VRIIVPYAPGGNTDFTARAVAEKLTEWLKRQFIVDNRPGGATNIGTETVAKAPPDGYTVLLHTSALASAGQPKTSNKTATEKKGTLTIPADPTGALAFQYGKATATAGRVSFDMPNKASIGHDIAVKDKSGKVLGKGPVVSGGGSSKFSTTLKSGSYEFFCTVPGHEAGGMKGTLTVK
jgi:plastocyanin